MSIFTQVEQAVSDYETCWTAFKSAEQQGKDITAAVVARIAADRAQVDERTATLTAQSRDIARPEVVRKLALQELDRLQEHTFEPTVDEATAFAAAMEDARAALRDFSAVKVKLEKLFREASEEMKSIRSGTLGNGSRDDDLARKWLDSEERSFALLGKTGQPGGMP